MAGPITTRRVTRSARAIPFEAGNLFGLSFSIWFKIMPTVLGTMLVFAVPLTILIVLLPRMLVELAPSEGPPNALTLYALAMIPVAFSVAANQLYVGSITFAAVQSLRNKPCSAFDSIRVALKRLWPLIGAALAVAVLVALGTLALIVPGIMIGCAYIVTTPVVVCENRSVTQSMKRSADLTRGHRVAVFVAFLLMGLVTWIFGLILGGIGVYAFREEQASLPYQFTLNIISTFIASVGSVLASVMYFALRQRKDGVEVDEIAKVFE